MQFYNTACRFLWLSWPPGHEIIVVVVIVVVVVVVVIVVK